MKTVNPFLFGKLAEKENFIDRDEDRRLLKSYLYSGINVIMFSPRRWGKSSLVKQSMQELVNEDKNLRVCFMDVSSVTSVQEFYAVFAKEVLRAAAPKYNAVMTAANRFLKRFSPKVSFGPDFTTEFTLSLSINDTAEDENEVLNLPERIAKEKKVQVIVCIDEFQELAKLSGFDVLEARMRSVWQHQQHVSYCLYGSQRHMMHEIFNSTEKPFYRFGQMFPLKKIPVEYWLEYIDERFASTGKKIPQSIAKNILEITERNSWYVQQLCSGVWNFTDQKADQQSLQNGIIWCVDANGETYRQICSALTETQVNFLRAVASGETLFTSAEVLNKYNMGTSATATKNKKALLEADIITAVPGKKQLTFLDPIFKIWFKETFCR